MNKEIRITAIVPVFNDEKYIGDCLDSLLNQTISFDRIIVVDDGSSDASVVICKEYANANNNISFYEIDHGKQGTARNYGLAHSNSNYVMFVDSDDYIQSNTVELLQKELECYEFDLLYYDAVVFPDGGKKTFHYCRSIEPTFRVMSGRAFFEYIYPRDYFASSCMNVYKKSFLLDNNINFPEGYYFEDNYMTFVSMIKATRVGYIKEKLYFRRVRPNSTVTSQPSIEKCRDYFSVVQMILDYINNKLDVNNDRMRQYISDLVYDALKYSEMTNLKDCETIKLFMLVWKLYLKICEKNNGELKNWNLGVLLKHWKSLRNIEKRKIDNLNVKDIKGQTEEILREKYIRLVDDLPLNQSHFLVGLYGKGKHTEELVRFYKHIYGEVIARIVYIETELGEETNNGTCCIEHLSQVCPEFVIISSYKNRDQMVKEICKREMRTEIVDIYDNIHCDLFSNMEYREFFNISLEGGK